MSFTCIRKPAQKLIVKVNFERLIEHQSKGGDSRLRGFERLTLTFEYKDFSCFTREQQSLQRIFAEPPVIIYTVSTNSSPNWITNCRLSECHSDYAHILPTAIHKNMSLDKLHLSYVQIGPQETRILT